MDGKKGVKYYMNVSISLTKNKISAQQSELYVYFDNMRLMFDNNTDSPLEQKRPLISLKQFSLFL